MFHIVFATDDDDDDSLKFFVLHIFFNLVIQLKKHIDNKKLKVSSKIGLLKNKQTNK